MKRILKTTLKIIWNIWGAFALLSTLMGLFYMVVQPSSYIADQIQTAKGMRKWLKVENLRES